MEEEKFQALYEASLRLREKRVKDIKSLETLTNQIIDEALLSIFEAVQQDSVSSQFVEKNKPYHFEVKISGRSDLFNDKTINAIVFEIRNSTRIKDTLYFDFIKFDFLDVKFDQSTQSIIGDIQILPNSKK